MVKVYDLSRQELTKKLQAGVKWVSSIDIHPRGMCPSTLAVVLLKFTVQGITLFWEGTINVCAGLT